MDNVFNFPEIQNNQGNDFEALPEDRYTVRVEKAEVVKTKKEPVRDMLKVTFVIDSGKHKGRKLWHQIVLTSKTQGILLGFLKALQSPLITQEGVQLHQILTDIVNRKATVYCKPTVMSNGNPSNELEKFMPVEYTKVSDGATAPAGKPSGSADIFG
jgi:hypothetical protein